MTLTAWWLLPLAIPVLWLGQQLVNRVRLFRQLDLPPAIAGGLCIAIIVMTIGLSGHPVMFGNKISNAWWQWIVTPETQWATPSPQAIYLPLSTFFFASVGLCASWTVARRGSWQLLLLLAIATGLGALQNVLGVSIARLMHAPPLLGVVCGSLTLTGGPSTALARTAEFEAAGFPAAAAVGTAAAMFGIVAASLLAGSVGGQIIRRFKLTPNRWSGESLAVRERPRVSLLGPLAALREPDAAVTSHLVILLLCMKTGAWVSLAWNTLAAREHWDVAFPVYMGAMVTAIAVRNAFEAFGINVLRTPTIEALGGVALRLFLAMAIASLDLLQLRAVAGPMAVILVSQTFLCVIFCIAVTFVCMGSDYDAAVMTAGHVGFGLGITPNAVASMENLTETFGPAPRGVLVATIVGAFLIDIPNAFLITYELHHVH